MPWLVPAVLTRLPGEAAITHSQHIAAISNTALYSHGRSAAALLPSSQVLVAAVLCNETEARRQIIGSRHSIGCCRWRGRWAALRSNGPALSLSSCSSTAQALRCCHSRSLCNGSWVQSAVTEFGDLILVCNVWDAVRGTTSLCRQQRCDWSKRVFTCRSWQSWHHPRR